ncbi:uncharacterized protein LOC111298440 [Durio zibethinus]|uniref:Uncharacterized protein LOC111298440 n=1 Tax=Durio zibethinus TaxID=66656 RepID=A0A6P5Z7Y2_DURZI|nr:uncharacterized protein LOC111298440 [Durio zibethinus]
MINRGGRVFSSPEIATSSHSEVPTNLDITFEGIAANVKLLLKLIHEQSHASIDDLDERRMQRVAGMITILDDVRTRIQKYSPPVGKSLKEFRRCNTDLRPHRAPRDKKSADVVVIDEKEKLRRELHSSSSARKSLEALCSSLGKEKEIMASELRKKVQELNGMEELINNLKAQNETLLDKVRDCAADHRDNKYGGETHQEGIYASLQERNKALSEQLSKSLDGYRSLKRKYKDAKEENIGIRTTMEEMEVEVAAGLELIHGLKQQLATKEVQKSDIEKEISELEYIVVMPIDFNQIIDRTFNSS